MFVSSFNIISYFQLEKNLFIYSITATSRRHTISLVYYHIKIIAMKLIKVIFSDKIEWKITQTNYFLYLPLLNKIQT